MERNKTSEDTPLTRRETLKIASAVGGFVWLESYLMGFLNIIDKNRREINLSLLKFKTAEVYAWQQGWPLVRETAHHFIGGDGSDLDISATLIDSLKRSSQKKDESDVVLLGNFFGGLISLSLKQEGLSSDRLNTGYRYIGVANSDLPDIKHSLRNFTIKVEGSVVDNSFRGSIGISDVYDWK